MQNSEATSRCGRFAALGRAARLLFGFALAAAALNAQFFSLNPLTPGTGGPGLRIYNLSVYTGYSTVDSNWTKVAQSLSGTSTTIPNYSVGSGINASLGFQTGVAGGRSSFGVVYSPSYSRSDAGWSASFLTHSLGLMWGLKMGRWQLSAGASGITGNFDQLIFSPTSGQSLASLLSTGPVTQGAVPPDQNTVGAPSATTISPQQRLLFGNRMLAASANVGLSYAATPRLSIGIDVAGSRMQHLVDNKGTAAQNAYLVPQSTNASASVNVAYSISPRTAVTGSGSYGKTFSALGHLQNYAGNLGISHQFSRNWYVELLGGGAYVRTPVNTATGITVGQAHGGQVTASLGLGYHVSHSQTLYAAVSRAVSDYYGVGATATMSSTVAWSWHRRGTSWSLQASGSQEKLLGSVAAASGLGNDGYRGNGGISWLLARHAVVAVQYAYLTFKGAFPLPGQTTGQLLSFSQQGVQLNVGWGGISESSNP